MYKLIFSILLVSSPIVLGGSLQDGVDQWVKSFFALTARVKLYDFFTEIRGNASVVIECAGGELIFPSEGVFRDGNVTAEKLGNGTLIMTRLSFEKTFLRFDVCKIHDRSFPMNASVSLVGPVADLKLSSYLEPAGTCATSLDRFAVRLNATLTAELDPDSKAVLAVQSYIDCLQDALTDDIKMTLDDTWKSSLGRVIEVSPNMCNPDL